VPARSPKRRHKEVCIAMRLSSAKEKPWRADPLRFRSSADTVKWPATLKEGRFRLVIALAEIDERAQEDLRKKWQLYPISIRE
jgi:hypothetical protein